MGFFFYVYGPIKIKIKLHRRGSKEERGELASFEKSLREADMARIDFECKVFENGKEVRRKDRELKEKRDVHVKILKWKNSILRWLLLLIASIVKNWYFLVNKLFYLNF